MTENFARRYLFDTFLAEISLGRQPLTRQRHERVLLHLDLYLDHVDVAPFVGTQPASLLQAEREFDPVGAFYRVFGPFELLCCLPGFVEAPWLLPGVTESRVQVNLTARLVSWLGTHGYLDMSVDSCAYLETKASIARTRRELG